MATYSGICILLLFTFAGCVQSRRHGWRPDSEEDHHHHRPDHNHDHDHFPDQHPPRHDDNGGHQEWSEPDSGAMREEHDDEDHDHDGPSVPYVIGLGLACLCLVMIVIGLAVFTMKKKKYLNKINSDPRRTPVVSVIKYPPPDYTANKTFSTARLPDFPGPLPPYEPKKGSYRYPVPSSEITAPYEQPPAYSFVSPTSPPPPYESS